MYVSVLSANFLANVAVVACHW